MSGLSGIEPKQTTHLSPFDAKLREMCERPETFSEPASVSLQRLLTYDGRLPVSCGMGALGDLDQELFARLSSSPSKIVRATTMSAPGEKWIRLFFNAGGRLHLRPADAPLPSYGERMPILPIGYLRMHACAFDDAIASVVAAREVEQSLRARVDRELERIERRGGLEELLDAVDGAVRHVEAVNIYVDDELFSVMERISTLIPGDRGGGVLESLRGRPSREWTSAQRLIVVGLRALFLAGRSIRFEEHNGQALTARRLFGRFREMATAYATRGVAVGLSGKEGLLELGAAVGRGAEQSVGKRWIRYRWVTGLTYQKVECVLDDHRTSEASALVPGRIRALYERWIGESAAHLDYEALFGQLADAALERTGDCPADLEGTPAKQPLEILIQEIVASSVLATGSDYGMSSSIRDLRPLLTDDQDALLERVLELKPKDFFTCVVSRPGLRMELGATIAPHVYRAVQNRMQFNRWHFMPGNFPERKIPRSRHYYYPPTMPDVAEWADQSHAGHTRAGVRYSIRAPGPDVSRPPLRIARHDYRGFYDIRVVRMEGPAFTTDEILVARSHCLWLGVVWDRIIAHVRDAAEGAGAFAIRGFEAGDGYEPAFDEAARLMIEGRVA